MELTETNLGLKGHWTLDIYEGDVRREKLPLKQRAWNLVADIKWKAFRQTASHYYRGEVLNTRLKTIEGDNLITTVGKQMIMQRIFGLAAVGAMTRTGVGTSNTAAAVTDTTLTGGVFVVYDATPTGSGTTTITTVTTFPTGTANIVWAELGMDNGTTLLNRIAPIGPFTKTAAVSIVVTVAVTQA